MSNAKVIWNILRANGCTEAGAAGVIGNMDAESSLIPFRRQGDMNATNGYAVSKDYTDRVDRGRITRDEFARNGPGGGGYGLCQWTYFSRKYALYDFAKSLGVSIGDLEMQAKFFCKECKENYSDVWKVVTSTASVQEASDAVLLRYERPANMYDKRSQRGDISQQYYDELTGTKVETAPEVKEEVEEPFVSVELPILRKGAKNGYVSAAQAVLIERGCSVGSSGADGDFGSGTLGGVKAFQEKQKLNPDGVIGANTWKALLSGE